jgi:hypothetical protein
MGLGVLNDPKRVEKFESVVGMFGTLLAKDKIKTQFKQPIVAKFSELGNIINVDASDLVNRAEAGALLDILESKINKE